MATKKITGDDMREARRTLGWSLDQLAEYWGVNRSTIGHLETRGIAGAARSRMYTILLAEVLRSKGKKQHPESLTGDELRAAMVEFGHDYRTMAAAIGLSLRQLSESLAKRGEPLPAGRRLAIVLQELRRKRDLARRRLLAAASEADRSAAA